MAQAPRTTRTASHAVITGGGRGIGAAIARRLANEGARLSLLGRDVARLEATAMEIAGDGADVAAIGCDVSDADSVAAAFAAARQRFGTVSILVNNAGQAQPAAFVDMKRALWDRMLAVNLTGVYLCTQQALPDMLSARDGRVVNIASTSGLRGYKQVSAYCAAKHGVVGLARALAAELAPAGVTVNAVCPGYTDTPMLAASVAAITAKTGRAAEDARAQLARDNTHGRLITPDEVAQGVLSLCVPAAASITGEAIAVSGGPS
jgi:NAD(P)-dependent dehydrogenase (short-subunit alcohol dehydrogenase family)